MINITDISWFRNVSPYKESMYVSRDSKEFYDDRYRSTCLSEYMQMLSKFLWTMMRITSSLLITKDLVCNVGPWSVTRSNYSSDLNVQRWQSFIQHFLKIGEAGSQVFIAALWTPIMVHSVIPLWEPYRFLLKEKAHLSFHYWEFNISEKGEREPGWGRGTRERNQIVSCAYVYSLFHRW